MTAAASRRRGLTATPSPTWTVPGSCCPGRARSLAAYPEIPEHGDRARERHGGCSSAQTEGMPVTTLQTWTEAACAELGIDPAAADARTVLDLARDVAHQIER